VTEQHARRDLAPALVAGEVGVFFIRRQWLRQIVRDAAVEIDTAFGDEAEAKMVRDAAASPARCTAGPRTAAAVRANYRYGSSRRVNRGSETRCARSAHADHSVAIRLSPTQRADT
jgi:hypothetical protein